MPRHQGVVLVDTNIILECWSIGAWRALTKGYKVETVEDCIIETQTGFQHRRAEQQVDRVELLASLAVPPHKVSEPEFAALWEKAPDIYLDQGERSLWAHALARNDAWVLCGPDGASLRLSVRLGLRERMIPLQELLDAVGYSVKGGLKKQFTSQWLSAKLSQLVVLEERRQ
jgi:hypothetical protein